PGGMANHPASRCGESAHIQQRRRNTGCREHHRGGSQRQSQSASDPPRIGRRTGSPWTEDQSGKGADMPSAGLTRPPETEYAPFYAAYVAGVPDGDVLDILRRQGAEAATLIGRVGEDRSHYRYAEGKWT